MRPDARPRRPTARWSGGRHAIQWTSAWSLGRLTCLRPRPMDVWTLDNPVACSNFKKGLKMFSRPLGKIHFQNPLQFEIEASASPTINAKY
jgi:hypothetical protein